MECTMCKLDDKYGALKVPKNASPEGRLTRSRGAFVCLIVCNIMLAMFSFPA